MTALTRKKTKERYDLSAFNSRVLSPEIVVFYLKENQQFLGTITLNLHLTSDALESAYFGYLSDLFVAQGLDNNAKFMEQFISDVFAKISQRFPNLKILSVMAAAGDLEIPIVKCFEHAKKAGLIHSFTRTEQERLGVVAQFTFDPQNTGNTHSSSLLRGISTLSLIDINTFNKQAKELSNLWNYKKTVEHVQTIEKHNSPAKSGNQVALEASIELLDNHKTFKEKHLRPIMENFVNFIKNTSKLSEVEKNLIEETRKILESIRDELSAEIQQNKTIKQHSAAITAFALANPSLNQSSPEMMTATANNRHALFNSTKAEFNQPSAPPGAIRYQSEQPAVRQRSR